MNSNTKITLSLEDINNGIKQIFSNRKRLSRIILILVILIIALGIRLINMNKYSETIDVTETTNIEEEGSTAMYVDISGEVKRPGVYRVDNGTRLYEVIEKAGGLTNDANTDQINQAGYVEDGEKIIIPSIDDNNSDNISYNDHENTNTGQNNGLININTANKDQLMSITGIGEVIAARIIEYRKSNKFKVKEDIMNVNGIGNATYEKMKDQICV